MTLTIDSETRTWRAGATTSLIVLFVAGRFLVALLKVPSFTYFLLYPVLVGAALSLPQTASYADSSLRRALWLLTLSVAASTAVNGVDLFAAVLLWASLATPFVVMIATHRSMAAKRIRQLTLGLYALQTVVVAAQVALGRWSDGVQGLLIGQGAGAHIVGFVAGIYSVYFAARFARGAEKAPTVVVVTVAAILTIIATGTNQAIIVTALGALTVACATFLRLPRYLVLTLPILAFIGLLAMWSSLDARVSYRDDYLIYKGRALATLGEQAFNDPTIIPFGLGPGQTLTRTGWNAASNSNLVHYLGIQPGRISQDLLPYDTERPPWRKSSFTSVFFSLGGVLGDLGALGLAAYLAAWILVLRAYPRGPLSHLPFTIVGMALLLGLFFSWLEEPVLMAFVGLLLAYELVE